MLDAYIGISFPRRQALTTANQPVPNAVKVRALVDTGASCTCVDPSVLQQLSLTPTGSTPINTPSTGTTPATANQYDVSLMIPGHSATVPALIRTTIPIVEAQLFAMQGFHVLIGRDILKDCLFTYDGQTSIFTLAY